MRIVEIILLLGCVWPWLSLGAEQDTGDKGVSSFLPNNNSNDNVNLKEKFSHKNHRKLFSKDGIKMSTMVPSLERKGISCTFCHLVNPLEDPENKKLYEKSKSDVEQHISLSCHFCHNNTQKISEAPSRCKLCHASVEPPINHKNYFWKSNHGLSVKFDAHGCRNCHTDSTCVKCHKSNETIRRDAHSRNFRFTHSIEARIRPQKCSHCHQATYCIACHSQKG